MNRRSALITIFAGLALPAASASAQQSTDIDRVKATSKEFYEALAKLDGGASMEKIWANKEYITFAGPRSKSFVVGWDALKRYWAETDKLFAERNASLTES